MYFTKNYKRQGIVALPFSLLVKCIWDYEIFIDITRLINPALFCRCKYVKNCRNFNQFNPQAEYRPRPYRKKSLRWSGCRSPLWPTPRTCKLS